MKKRKSTIYIAKDGKEFTKEKDCVDHEKLLEDEAKTTTYWVINHSPDLTEGRGMGGRLYVKLKNVRWSAGLWMKYYCYLTFGAPTAFVQGTSPIEGWTLLEIDRSKRFQTRM